MANRLIEGWANVPLPAAAGWVNRSSWTPLVGTPYTLVVGDTASGQVSLVDKTADGYFWIQQRTSSSYAQRLGIARLVSSIVTLTGNSIIFGGFRVKSPPTGVSMSIQTGIFALIDAQGAAPNSSYQNLISWTDLGPQILNNEYYVEWSIDMNTSTFKFRVDGGAEVSRALSTTIVNILNNPLRGMICWGYPYGSSGNGYTIDFKVKDIYVNEKTTDGLNSGWLGPVSAVPLYVESVTGTSVVTGAANAKAALNTEVTLTTLDTPLVTTDGEAPSLDLKLGVGPFTGRVFAVSMKASAKRPGGNSAGLKSTVSNAGGVVGSVFTPLLPTMNSVVPVYQADATPDNKPWSREALLALKVKLTASNS